MTLNAIETARHIEQSYVDYLATSFPLSDARMANETVWRGSDCSPLSQYGPTTWMFPHRCARFWGILRKTKPGLCIAFS